jgi:hypothetical protein
LTGRRILRLAGDKRIIGHGDSVFARIAVGFPERIELFEVSCLEPGLGQEVTPGRILERLARMHPASRKRPKSGKGSRLSTDQQDCEFVRIATRPHGEDHDADSDGGPGPSTGCF